MTDFFKPDPRITDPALRDLEKKIHWLMYQIAQSNRSALWDSLGLDPGQIVNNTFPDNFDPDNIYNDAEEVQNNNSN